MRHDPPKDETEETEFVIEESEPEYEENPSEELLDLLQDYIEEGGEITD